MRYSSKKIVLAMLTVLFAVLLAAVPMTAFAADVIESTSIVTITAEGMSIAPDEADGSEVVIHAMTVEVTGGSASSFEIEIRMPAFLDVVAVKESERLAAVSENGVFEWYVDKNSGYVNVAYSSPFEFSYIPLFDIEFTVNDYSVQYATPECVSARLVNSQASELIAYFNFGAISIGEASSTMMGDVDGNGTVDLADLLIIQRSIVNPNYPLSDAQIAVADINRDGAVNIIDCQYIQNYLVGKIGSLENVGQCEIEISVYDQNGNMLFGGVRVAAMGESYGTFMTPIFRELSARYNITGNLSIYSKEYGQVDPGSTGEGFVVKGEDSLIITVNVNYGTEVEPTVVYTYNMSMRNESEDGVASVTDISYIFYSNGIVRGVMTLTVNGKVEKKEEQEAIWIQVGQYIDITFEGETKRMFQVDENGNVSIYQGGGEDVQPEEPELEEYKNKYYNDVKMTWNELTQKYGDLSQYKDMMHEILKGIENATSISEVNHWHANFKDLVSRIEGGVGDCQHIDIRSEGYAGDCYNAGYDATYCNNCGMCLNYVVIAPAGHIYNEKGFCERCGEGGYVEQDWVQYVELDLREFSITAGASYEELLSKIVGQPLRVCYSQSGIVMVPITADMINYENVALDTIGSYNVMITYVAKDGSYHSRDIWVTVNPDMSEVPLLGTYKIDFDGEMGFTEFMLYEGGVAVMNGGYYDNVFTTYYMVSEGVAAVDMEGGYLVFSLGEDVATFFDPANELEIIGTYVYGTPYGTLTLVVYGEYTGAGDYVTVMRVQQKNPETGEMMDMTITTVAYLDRENCEIRHVMFGNMNYDEAGKIYCPHTEVRTDGWDGDCWNNGYRRTYCANCHEELFYEITTPAGHVYDDRGFCVRCGEGSGYVEQDWVQYVELDLREFSITAGASYEELLSKIVGQPLRVCYSQSGIVMVPITADMINYENVALDTIGSYNVMITYVAKDGSYHSRDIWVTVNPDMSKVQLLGTYKIDFDGEMGFTEFMLYEGGTAVMSGGYYDNVFTTYYMVSEGVAAVDMEGGYLVFSLGEGVATFFDPANELEMIGTYVYGTPYGTLTLVVYGEYTGAGDYVTVMRVQQKNPETGEMMDMTITTVAYLDRENCEIRHVMFGNMNYDEAGKIYCPHTEVRTEGWEGDCYSNGWRRTYCANCREELNYEVIPTTGHNFNENGWCDRCGTSQGGVENDLNNYKNQILKQMMNEWSDITNGMPVSEDLQARFNQLTAVIKEAGSYGEVDSLYYNEFRWLCDEARAATNVYLQHWEMNPNSYHVTVGTSLEQFIAEFIKNVTITLYYTDGSSAVQHFTEDMLKYDDLNLSVVGRTHMSANYYDEKTGSSIGFGLSIYVDPDMSGAELVGSYTYVGNIMNAMEWERAELYDNGIMILSEGDYSEFVAYTLSGDVLSYVTYDATIVYRIVSDSEVTFYQSEQVIGKYTYTEEDREGFTMTVFGEYTGAGEYYAYVEIFEIYRDTYEYYGATTLVHLDMEAGKIYCEMVEGWWTIVDENNFIPWECEHEFDEKGECIHCGYQQSTDSGSTGDAVVDTEKLPTVEMVPSTDGSASYTEGVYTTVAA